MCTRTNTKTSTLMAAYAGYADSVGMPEPTSIHLRPEDLELDIHPRVQAYTDPVAVLSSLLLWTRNLHGITGTWRRTTGESLHISITGRLNSGVRVTVYDGIDYQAAAGLVYLEPEQSESVALDELSFLAAELHGTPAA
ncbi:hypothetical protein [Sciscionella marina]|uniref:hypothetical protein n=1 Tax=Sciscionella marina TaxID=508770 RepID=UPI0003811D97|nr:hypothetical protein [Sciscionella marina]